MPKTAASAHGTSSRWRLGCRCDDCWEAHRVHQRAERRAKSIAALRPHRAKILRALAHGRSVDEALLGTGLTPGNLYGIAKWDQEWAAQLDSALLAGRDPRLRHGTEVAYKVGRCRCPECRAAHAH